MASRAKGRWRKRWRIWINDKQQPRGAICGKVRQTVQCAARQPRCAVSSPIPAANGALSIALIEFPVRKRHKKSTRGAARSGHLSVASQPAPNPDRKAAKTIDRLPNSHQIVMPVTIRLECGCVCFYPGPVFRATTAAARCCAILITLNCIGWNGFIL